MADKAIVAHLRPLLGLWPFLLIGAYYAWSVYAEIQWHRFMAEEHDRFRAIVRRDLGQ